MNRSAREGKSVKTFERSNGPDIALYKNYLFLHPFGVNTCTLYLITFNGMYYGINGMCFVRYISVIHSFSLYNQGLIANCNQRLTVILLEYIKVFKMFLMIRKHLILDTTCRHSRRYIYLYICSGTWGTTT